MIIPKGSTKLQANDKIHIVGTIKEIKDFLEYAELIEEKTKKVIICGGSTTAVYLARNLLDLKMQVKIIEIDSIDFIPQIRTKEEKKEEENIFNIFDDVIG
jgi:trk system potassium uptake protein TrkA